MPVVSADIWKILYTVSRYLFPVLAVSLVFLILLYILSESRIRREKLRTLPGSGTVGELVVLSGGRDLDANTWFPVPREGVLGSVRSCDLVIPCPGVRSKHLDFSWEDGKGMLIRPRTGCEVQINGTPVTCRTRVSDVPLTHGSVLQVGSAVLRLHLFAALDSSIVSVQSPQQDPALQGTAPVCAPFPAASAAFVPPLQPDPFPAAAGCPAQCVPESPSSAETPAVPQAASERPRRSDRWKEDLGE